MTVTITKSLLGKEDCKMPSKPGENMTFTRPTSTGGTATLHKFDWVGIDILQVYGTVNGATDVTIQAAIDAIGNVDTVVWFSMTTWSISTSVTLPSKWVVIVPAGTTITVATSKTMTISGILKLDGMVNGSGSLIIAKQPVIPDRQVFGSSLTVTFSIAVEITPFWWGAVADFATSDRTAFQSALSSFSSAGGVLKVPNNVFLGNSTGLILPNDGSATYPIVFKGDAVSPMSASAGSYGGSQVKYTGSGILIDGRNGTTANLDCNLRIENCQFFGDSTYVAGSIGLNTYDAHEVVLFNTSFKRFETGFKVSNYSYYAYIEHCSFWYCRDGVWINSGGSGVNFTKFNRCKLNSNGRYGLHVVYGGTGIGISGCWFELNTTDAIYITDAVQVNLDTSYFEVNGTSHQVYIAGTPFYDTQVNCTNLNFESSSIRYSLYLSDVPNLNIIGGLFYSYSGTAAIYIDGYPTRGFLLGAKGPPIAGVRLINRSNRDSFLTDGQSEPLTGPSFSKGAYTINVEGDFLHNTLAGVAHGYAFGWLVNEPGAGGSVTALSVPTVTTVAGDATITFATAPTGLYPGATIQIAGETFNSTAQDYATIVKFTSTKVAELDVTADVGVAAAAVSWNAHDKYPIRGLELKKTTTNVSTSGTSETTLATFTAKAGKLGTNSGFSLLAFGTKTGTGTHTFKLYFGATSWTLAAPTTAVDWIVKTEVHNNAVDTQDVFWEISDCGAAATIIAGVETATIDTDAADTILKLTCQCTGTDTSTCNFSVFRGV